MITKQQLEDIGFKWDGSSLSPYTGHPSGFSKVKDNRHIIKGHDITEIFITIDDRYVRIELSRISSHEDPRKYVVFNGSCENIEFLKQILNAVV